MTLVKFNNGHKAQLANPFLNDVYSLLNNQVFNEKYALGTPAVNIAETENQFEVELAVPGLKKEDFKINLEKNVLNISADKKVENVEEVKKYSKLHTHSSWGTFRTVFYIILIAFAVFIFITQQQATQRLITVLTSLGALLPAMLKLFDTSGAGKAVNKQS